MDDDEDGPDPFGVRLEWPEEQLGKAFDPPASERPASPAPPEPEPVSVQTPEASFGVYAPPPAPPLPQTVDPTSLAQSIARFTPVDAEIADLPTLLAKIVARVDALTSTTSTFRNLVSDRVSASTERVAQMVGEVAAQADEQRRRSDHALGELRRGLGAATDAIERLTAAVETAAGEVQRVGTELGDQLAKVSDEVQTLRRRTPVRPRTATERDEAPATRRPPRRNRDLES